MVKVLSFSSVRGGVGKTNLALETALYLSEQHKVLLVDADFYAPSLLNEITMRSKGSIKKAKNYFRDFLKQSCKVEDAIVNLLPRLDIMFSDPQINLWDLSKDVGTKDFWIKGDMYKVVSIDTVFNSFKDYLNTNHYEYLIFDVMGGLYYPVVYFCYISTAPILVSRPAVAHINDIIKFISLIGVPETPVNLIWGLVPPIDNYLANLRQKIESQIINKCQNNVKIVGFIPQNPSYDKKVLEGTIELKSSKDDTIFFNEFKKIIDKINFMQ